MLSPRISATLSTADELAADQERLRQAPGVGLHGVADRDADLAAVAEHALEVADVLGRRDQEDLADAGEHQRRERVVDHRLVVDRQELLADGPRDRVEPRARAAGQDDPLGMRPLVRHRRGPRPGCSRILVPDRHAIGRRRAGQAGPAGVVSLPGNIPTPRPPSKSGRRRGIAGRPRRSPR